MPELPEVETTRRGIVKLIRHKTIKQVIIRQPKLRWQVPLNLITDLPGSQILQIKRRGKYLLIKTTVGWIIIHLGMSGSLRVLTQPNHHQKHDHVDIIFTDNSCLRYTDPRRFGSIHWTTQDPLQHPLLKSLGPEPLSSTFNGDYLYEKSRNRTIPIKSFLMNSQVVVGVGNIYANEALFLAQISPLKPAGTLSKRKYQHLSQAIQTVLAQAIHAGGTTLKDFYQSDGKPGYFKQKLNIYGKDNQPCPRCAKSIKKIILNQRASYYCPRCQRS